MFKRLIIAFCSAAPMLSFSAHPVEIVSSPASQITIESGNTQTFNYEVKNQSGRTLTFSTTVTGDGMAIGNTGNTCSNIAITDGSTCVLPIEFTAPAAGTVTGTVFISFGGRYSVTNSITFTVNAATNWLTSVTDNLGTVGNTNVQALDAIDNGGNTNLLAGTANGIFLFDDAQAANSKWSDLNAADQGPFSAALTVNRNISAVYFQTTTNIFAANGDGLFKATLPIGAHPNWTLATGIKAAVNINFGGDVLTLQARDALASSAGNNLTIEFVDGANNNCVNSFTPIDEANAITFTSPDLIEIEVCKNVDGTLITSTVEGIRDAINNSAVSNTRILASGTGVNAITLGSHNLNATIIGGRVDGIPQFVFEQDDGGNIDTNASLVTMARSSAISNACTTGLQVATNGANGAFEVTTVVANPVEITIHQNGGQTAEAIADLLNVPASNNFVFGYSRGTGGGNNVSAFGLQTLTGCRTGAAVSSIDTIVGSGADFLLGYNGGSLGVTKTADATNFTEAGNDDLLNELGGQNITDITRVKTGITHYFATVANTGVARTIDSGSNWDNITNDLGDTNVRAITSPSTNVVYVGTASGVFKSTNADDAAPANVTWTKVGSTVGGLTSIQSMDSINGDNDKVYVGTPQGFFETTDGGTTWIKIATAALPGNANVKAVKVLSPTEIYAGFTGGVAKR